MQQNPPGGGGKCPQPKTIASGSPGALLPAGPPKVIGTVASVAGNTINVTVTDANGNPSQTAVTVTDKTHYSKGAPATSQAIAQGKCITASGTKDGGGTLQATLSPWTPPTKANARSLPLSSSRTNDRSTRHDLGKPRVCCAMWLRIISRRPR